SGREPGQSVRDGGERQTVVDRYASEGAPRHVPAKSLRRVLHDRDPAARLDLEHPGGAVVLGAGENHAGDTLAIGASGRAEERIDRGPAAVLARPRGKTNDAGLEQEMMVGRSDVDLPGTDRFTVEGMPCR